MKPAWSRVKLAVHGWHSQPPQPGDALETRTGRRYLIVKARPKMLECLVLPPGEAITGTVFLWEWSVRKRRHSGGR